VWAAIGKQRPHTVSECWPWFIEVSSVIRGLDDENSSVEDIWDRLRGQTNAYLPEKQKSACLLAIFAVLCWGTMALQPKLDWSSSNNQPTSSVPQQQPNQAVLRMDSIRRPIPAMFLQFQRIMSTSRWRHPISETKNATSAVLHVASLNYASLFRIGKIHVVWVDDLSSHLDFDATNRRLSVFKFPTFCALSALEGSRVPPIFAGSVKIALILFH